MLIISFAKTTPALLAGIKTVTRRFWTAGHAAKFRKGMKVQAWDKSPRYHGKQVGVIRLTEKPYLEPLRKMPEEDVAAEGVPGVTTKEQFIAMMGGPNETPYVVRFKLVGRIKRKKPQQVKMKFWEDD